MNIFFFISMLLALATGYYNISETSSMTSDNPTPIVTYRIEWPCGLDIETCWLEYENGIVRTGP